MLPHAKEEPFHDPFEALDRLLSRFGYRGIVIGEIAPVTAGLLIVSAVILIGLFSGRRGNRE